jgi:1-deoxy-D-xylulose 5-phosphate reductoisomerase
MANAWLLPAAIVGVSGLALQGAKAGWDMYLGIANRNSALNGARLQEATASMNFIEVLPLDQTQKALYKLEIVRLLQGAAEVQKIYEVVQKAMRAAGAE